MPYTKIVVKVGTSTLTHATGQLNLRRIETLCRTLSDIKNAGREVVLVTSGAIGVGTAKLGLPARPRDTRGKQAAAAVGQCQLMHIYDKFFGEYGHPVAQMLLTRDVVDDLQRATHARNAMQAIIDYGAIPVINENDSVAVEEIEFGDNDTLSAYVAKLCEASVLVLLSDIDGLYDKHPTNPTARRIDRITCMTPEIQAMAGGAGSQNGTGGMVTKLHAAQICLAAGIDMIIANGDHPEILYDLIEGRINGSIFSAK